MKPFEIKDDTHIVLKVEDVEQLSAQDQFNLHMIIENVKKLRTSQGKKINAYYVVNRDEQYAGKILDVIKQNETPPPTVYEICKALSEQLKLKVSYGAKQFYYKIENTECIMFVTETYGDGLWSINDYLPPHLIMMIGRFYEGLENKK